MPRALSGRVTFRAKNYDWCVYVWWNAMKFFKFRSRAGILSVAIAILATMILLCAVNENHCVACVLQAPLVAPLDSALLLGRPKHGFGT